MSDIDPITLAREVLDDYESMDDWNKPHTRSGREVLPSRVTLARAALAVSELHRPIRVYDDCGDPECPNDHVWVADTVACEDSAIGWACARCCYYGEHPLECADHKGDHKGVPADQACATRTALNGGDA